MSVVTPEAPDSPESTAPVWKQPAVRHLLLIALLAEIGYAVLNISTMPVYLQEAPGPHGLLIPEGRGLGASVIGLVVTAFLLSEAIFKSPMGALADRFGHRKLMFVGPVITTCTSLLTLLIPMNAGAWEVLCLILLRVFDGIGAAMLWPAAFSRMGSAVNDQQRQQAMSLLNLCYIVGIAIAMPIGGAVNVAFGHKYASLFLACALFAGVALCVFKLIPAHEEPHSAVVEGHAEVGFKDLVRSVKEIPSYLMLAVVTFAGIGFPMAIIKLFAQDEFKMNEVAFGVLVLPAAISMALFSVPLSKFGEKLGKGRAVHIGLGLCAIGLGVMSLGGFLPFLRTGFALALCGLPVGVGFLLTIPAWMASVSDIDPNRRGANIGAVMTAQGLGAIIGAPIGSAMYEKLGFLGSHLAHYSPLIACAICVTFGWMLSLRLLRAHT